MYEESDSGNVNLNWAALSVGVTSTTTSYSAKYVL